MAAQRAAARAAPVGAKPGGGAGGGPYARSLSTPAARAAGSYADVARCVFWFNPCVRLSRLGRGGGRPESCAAGKGTLVECTDEDRPRILSSAFAAAPCRARADRKRVV